MTSYVIYERGGNIAGPYLSLEAAQEEAQLRADAYASADPNLTVRNTSTYYVCVLTTITTTDRLGINLTNNQQSISYSWTITMLNSS